MSATLTVNLDSEILQLAEQEARARHTTLPEVVARQLRVWLAIGRRAGRARHRPRMHCAAAAKLPTHPRLYQSGPMTGQQYSISKEYALQEAHGEPPQP